eukprot:TRINITY_DN7672_c0_g1_i3.p1 TRINITY_DN7672_c0_g1~~TRINITY_DN7672_c0_g1_i3.p1  ORF type:complete len:432 (-),score=93.38 TRINITY_DN7672_c0_g1_i3:67-1362(-)
MPAGSGSNANGDWRLPGLHCVRLRHQDGSVFAVDFDVRPFIAFDSNTLYSVTIRRRVEGENGSCSEGHHACTDEQCCSAKLWEGKSIGDWFTSKTLGRGNFGKVRLAIHKTTRVKAAIKTLPKKVMSAVELERTRREIDILRRLSHPNICKLYDVLESEDALHIVLEYGGTTLLSHIRGGISEAHAHSYFSQLCSAVQCCHSQNIIHRDIKHGNILLGETGGIKLIDFGLSNFMEAGKLRSTYCGTPNYAPPEMILGKQYHGAEVDLFSLGVVLFSMLTGTFPFLNVPDLLKGKYEDPPKASPECRQLIRKMLTVDPEKRATLPFVMQHPWFVRGPKPEDHPTACLKPLVDSPPTSVRQTAVQGQCRGGTSSSRSCGHSSNVPCRFGTPSCSPNPSPRVCRPERINPASGTASSCMAGQGVGQASDCLASP